MVVQRPASNWLGCFASKMFGIALLARFQEHPSPIFSTDIGTQACMRAILALFTILCFSGCHSMHADPAVPQPSAPNFVAPGSGGSLFQAPGQVTQNTSKAIFIPVTNEDYAWEVIVDVVDDYFRIDQENRVQMVGNVMTEGRIDTFPQVGATALEPNHFDSVGRYNLAESTFQSVRRRGEVRVVPQQGGYMVDIAVYKEFEDLPRPENSTAGAASFRFDNSLTSRLDEQVSRTRLSPFWIPMGRDCEIETQMLLEIQERITNPPE
jgi:hypothetical protein